LPLAKSICVFCLETKGTKSSRKNDASTAQGKTPGPPFFHPTARVFCFIGYLFFLVKICQGTKVIVSGGYERLSINDYVQGFDICIKDAFRISALSNASKNHIE
jgi:hypothetical protein